LEDLQGTDGHADLEKHVIVERLNGQSASAEKSNAHSCSGESIKHLAILELQQFRMMQLPTIIIDDIQTEPPTRCPGSKSFSATPGLSMAGVPRKVRMPGGFLI